MRSQAGPEAADVDGQATMAVWPQGMHFVSEDVGETTTWAVSGEITETVADAFLPTEDSADTPDAEDGEVVVDMDGGEARGIFPRATRSGRETGRERNEIGAK